MAAQVVGSLGAGRLTHPSPAYTTKGYDNLQRHGLHKGRSQLPYPWVQLADPNGRIYYSNQQTGVSTWDPRVPYYPQQGYESV